MIRFLLIPLLFFPEFASASASHIDLTSHWAGYLSLIIFVLAYGVVMGEEVLHIEKSKPVLIAAGLIWVIIAWVYAGHGDHTSAEHAARHNILEFAELMLFLLVAMTYVNAMEERRLFERLRVELVKSGMSLRMLFWVTGALAFIISPIADNLTTALLMCAVVMAVGGDNNKFIGPACINIVVAANAGGAFSPFGDITTLMVWQKGIIEFGGFLALFVPSLVNWFVPAFIMSLAIPSEKPQASDDNVEMKRGAKRIVALFLITIGLAVSFHNYLYLPPVMGMMLGLGLLKIFSIYLRKTLHRSLLTKKQRAIEEGDEERIKELGEIVPFNVFQTIARAEWDTLLFFYGVVLCVGGLGFIGYLELMSGFMYEDMGATTANVLVGILSAIVDNIPVMFAVLTMMPEMSQGQWLLVTLTAGVGGSLLSIGSAAGVALMGQAKGKYTFFGHLKWSWAIALGYIASIAIHLWINSHLFEQTIH